MRISVVISTQNVTLSFFFQNIVCFSTLGAILSNYKNQNLIPCTSKENHHQIYRFDVVQSIKKLIQYFKSNQPN